MCLDASGCAIARQMRMPPPNSGCKQQGKQKCCTSSALSNHSCVTTTIVMVCHAAFEKSWSAAHSTFIWQAPVLVSNHEPKMCPLWQCSNSQEWLGRTPPHGVLQWPLLVTFKQWSATTHPVTKTENEELGLHQFTGGGGGGLEMGQ